MMLKILLSLGVLFASTYAQVDRSVIIVGGGIAGYGAARRLLENGFTDIIILERVHRTGGRIVSMSFNNALIDMGAVWVHGQRGNSIWEMVSPHFNFGTTPLDQIFPTFVLSNGTTPNQNDYRDLFTLGLNILDEIFSLVGPRGTFGDLFLSRFNAAAASPQYNHISADIVEHMRRVWHRYVNGYFGSMSWFDLSAFLISEQGSTEGHNYNTWRREGFITVFDFIQRRRPNPGEFLNIDGRALVNKHVININYNPNNPNTRATVSCLDGTSYTARHVIFTASLGVLKQNHTNLFTPPLPAAKVNAITHMGYGLTTRMYLEFTHPWWVTPGVPFVQFVFMWTDVQRNAAIARGSAYLVDMYAIYAVDQFPNVFLTYFTGPNAIQVEVFSTARVIDDIIWMLDLFLPQFRPIPRPINTRKTSFQSLDMFRGVYSYPSMSAELNGATIAHLASPIRAVGGMPQILFAGEATSDLAQGYTHGAMDSGARAAQEIIDFYFG